MAEVFVWDVFAYRRRAKCKFTSLMEEAESEMCKTQTK